MGLRKGQTNNPNGRPKKPEIEALRRAVKAVETKQGKKLLDHFVETAYEDKTVLVALMKKFLPDLKAVDGVFTGADGEPLNIIISVKNAKP